MLDEDVARLRKQVKALYRRLQRDLPAASGLSLTTLQILSTVDRSSTSMRPGELAAELQMTDSNVAAALRSLEGQKFVSRRSDPADGRKAFVDITELGRIVAEDIRRGHYSELRASIQSLLTQREQKLLIQAGYLMQRLADEIRSDSEGGAAAAKSKKRAPVKSGRHDLTEA